MRHFFTSLLLLAAVITANAQFSATKIIDQCRPCNTKDVQSADFDNDGDRDVLIVGFVKGELAYSENEGNAVFSEPEIILDANFYLNAAYPGDLNNDGWMDIVVAGIAGVTVGYLLNDGAGGFDEVIILEPITDEAVDIQTADLDGDGWLDIVAASNEDSRVYWFRNEAGVGFSEELLIAADMHQTFGLTTGDIDGDGDIDIFVPADVNYATSLSWLRNNGQGEFNLEDFPSIGSAVDQVSGWELADMDQDGDLDVVTTTRFDGLLRWHRNNGGGDFSLPIEISGTLVQPQRLDVADLDNDGDLDIIVASSGADSALAFINNGDNTYSSPIFLNTRVNYVRTVHAAELNGDGLMDIISVSANDDEVVAYINSDNLTFSKVFIQNPPFAGLNYVKTADLTGDGREDMIVYAYGDPNFVYLPFQSDETFGEARPIHDFFNPRAIAVADVDGNGYNDVISIDEAANQIFWYPNQEGEFSFRRSVAPAFPLSYFQENALLAEDMDSDGDPDIIGVSFASSKVFYYANLGDSDFAEPEVISEWDSTNEEVVPLVIEWNEEDEPWLFLLYKLAGKVTVQNHEAVGFSGEQIILENLSGAQQIGALDANADGEMDLLVLTNSVLSLYFGDGTGLVDLTPEVLLTDPAFSSFQIADLDNNGSSDIALFTQEESGEVDGRLYALYTTMDGNITAPVALVDFTIPGDNPDSRERFFLTDIEGDNDFDLIFYQKEYVFLGWKENLLLTTSTEKSIAINDLTAYPNPFQDQVSLKGELWESNNLASLYLWNSNGQLISIIPVDAQLQPKLPVDLPKGTYYLDGRDRVGQQLQLLTIVKQ